MLYRKPKDGDFVEKYNPTEIPSYIHEKTGYSIKPGKLGRILKSLKIENKRMHYEGVVNHIFLLQDTFRAFRFRSEKFYDYRTWFANLIIP